MYGVQHSASGVSHLRPVLLEAADLRRLGLLHPAHVGLWMLPEAAHCLWERPRAGFVWYLVRLLLRFKMFFTNCISDISVNVCLHNKD